MAKLFGEAAHPVYDQDHEGFVGTDPETWIEDLDIPAEDLGEQHRKEIVKLFLRLYNNFEIDEFTLKNSLQFLQRIAFIKNAKTYFIKAKLDEGVRGVDSAARGAGKLNPYDGAAVAKFYNGLQRNRKRKLMNPQQRYTGSVDYARELDDDVDYDNPVWIQVELDEQDTIAVAYFPAEHCIVYDPPAYGRIAIDSQELIELSTSKPVRIDAETDDEYLKQIWELAQPQIEQINENNKEATE